MSSFRRIFVKIPSKNSSKISSNSVIFRYFSSKFRHFLSKLLSKFAVKFRQNFVKIPSNFCQNSVTFRQIPLNSVKFHQKSSTNPPKIRQIPSDKFSKIPSKNPPRIPPKFHQIYAKNSSFFVKNPRQNWLSNSFKILSISAKE